jgi:putative ABC transport system permease protein
MSLWSRIANVFRSDRLSRELDEELASHLAEAVEQGRDPGEANRALGRALYLREKSRDLKLLPWLDSLRADAVFGWRQLLKRKATSAAAILSLALAIGACGAAFRLIDALFLRPLPIAAADRLYTVAFQSPHALTGKLFTSDSCSYPMFVRMRAAVKDRAESVAVSLYGGATDVTYGSDQEMEKAVVQYVSGWMFPTFGLRPALGRLLTADDDGSPGAHPYAVLTYDYWTRRFGRDPKVLGRTMRVGNDVVQIVGVGPAKFTGTDTGFVTSIFLPMSMIKPRILASLNNSWLRTLVHLKPGAAPESVQETLRATWRAIQEERIKGFPNQTQRDRDRMLAEKLLVQPASAGRSNLQREYRQALVTLAVLVALVLLIACANVANLMTAQAASRAREMALRVSIGAGRWRLVQLVLVESAWLAFLATALGALFTWWAAPFMVGRITFGGNPVRLALPADWRVLGFGLALACGVTFLFGLAPALRASAVKPASALRGGEDPHSRRRLMHALIAAQVAFCFIVHLAAGLFVSTLQRLVNQPLGFSAERLLDLETVTSFPQPAVYWSQVADHLRTVPGIEEVALIGWPPMSGESAVANVSVHGAPPSEVFSDVVFVSPRWTDTLRIPLLSGRDFRPADLNPAVAIVNRAFAKQYFEGADPVGQTFERVNPAGGRNRTEIVGLVPDARSRDDLRVPIRPTIYVPFDSLDAKGQLQPRARATFLLRTSAANPLAMASILRREVPRARPEFRVRNVEAQTAWTEASTIRERLLAMLAVFFAAVAILLAGVGLYGVFDYSVVERRREFGIRIAIGAPAGDIAWRVTAQVFRMIAIGAIAGFTIGVASQKYLESLLYQVKATDPAMLALPLLTIVVAAFAAALPAIARAVRIDPVQMLRVE